MRKINSNNRQIIIDFIKYNPNATYKDIRKKIKLHPERYFKSLSDAFIEANIKLPRTFERKTKEENKKLIIDYVRENPMVGVQKIRKETKININSIFKNVQEMYKAAGVEYPRKNIYKLSPKEKREIAIELVKKDPFITISEISKNLGIKNIYRLFDNLNDLYNQAGVNLSLYKRKIREKKRRRVIEFVKQNQLATQREINIVCKTHVQNIFEKGIFEAYEKAGVVFPFERLKLHGVALKEIKERAKSFEDEIAIKLSGFGKVNQLVKTKRGVADIILERNNKKIIIEIKDFQNKDISISQVIQLNRYLEDLNTDLGILICHKKPKKDTFLIGKNKIFIIEKQELNRIPSITEI